MKQYKNISEIAKSFGVAKGDFIYLSSDIMALAFITKKMREYLMQIRL